MANEWRRWWWIRRYMFKQICIAWNATIVREADWHVRLLYTYALPTSLPLSLQSVNSRISFMSVYTSNRRIWWHNNDEWNFFFFCDDEIAKFTLSDVHARSDTDIKVSWWAMNDANSIFPFPTFAHKYVFCFFIGNWHCQQFIDFLFILRIYFDYRLITFHFLSVSGYFCY